MMIKEFLEAYRLDYYDPEEIVKRNNCNNRIDFYWVKYQNFGPQTYEEMRSLTEPPWAVGVLEDYYKPSYENVVGEFKWKEFYKENVWTKDLK